METQAGGDFWTTKRTGELDAKLDPKLTAQRQAFGAGQGGRKLTYLPRYARSTPMGDGCFTDRAPLGVEAQVLEPWEE